MSTEAHWQRAVLLFQQQRWDHAIHELRGVLAQEPDHAFAHALLAQALAQTDALDEALREAHAAIGLAPDADFTHYSLAVVHQARDELPPAAEAVLRAIELDPDDANSRAMLAQIRMRQRRWADALAAADEGLALDAEHTDCLNLRSLALTKLGRGAEATDTVDASLAHDPDNPYTHQARGFALLQQGDAHGALHHFQEALRRDPSLDGARAGLVEALKARNPLYRLVLGWFLWLDRFSNARRLQIAFGLWLLARFGAEGLEQANLPLAATVVRFSWLGFVLLTACTVPLFNLLLLLHPIGRHALERTARYDALLLGACLVVGLGVGLHAWLMPAIWSYLGWIFWLVFLLPVASIGLFHPGWGRRTMQGFCAGCLVFWLWWCIQIESAPPAEPASPPAPQAPAQGEWNSSGSVASPQQIAHWKRLAGQHNDLVLAIVLSTWFVLLAPKGRPRRRRAGS